MAAKFGIGQAVRRVEDQRFLTGKGRYVDDITLPGMCHGVNLLSPHAHARIKTIDTTKAKAASTSARKTAVAAEKATTKAADKVGTPVATPVTPAAE